MVTTCVYLDTSSFHLVKFVAFDCIIIYNVTTTFTETSFMHNVMTATCLDGQKQLAGTWSRCSGPVRSLDGPRTFCYGPRVRRVSTGRLDKRSFQAPKGPVWLRKVLSFKVIDRTNSKRGFIHCFSLSTILSNL